ncbi:MAG TPA: hypothetical protein VFF59_12780, partial [Anaerolineae bacterium]|nr:hypothetical protein [Anaerolineae bacterium]
PRFLHSTGQLHKGGANKGVFIQLTADAARDLPIEGKGLTFGTLIRAQALGDLQALQSRGYRVTRIHLGKNVAAGLAAVQSAVAAALGVKVAVAAKAPTSEKATVAKKSAPAKKAVKKAVKPVAKKAVKPIAKKAVRPAAKKTAAKRPAAKKKTR